MYQRLSASDMHLISQAAGSDLNYLAAELNRGGCEFFKCGGCAVLVRTEQTDRGRELVICCVEGKGLKPALQRVITDARKQGFESLRYHMKSRIRAVAAARLFGLPAIAHTEPDNLYMTINLKGCSDGQ